MSFKINQPAAHVDQLVRQTRDHHVQLSAMADLKANILMTLASVVITISAGYVSDPELKWGAIVLIIFCLITLSLAVYTVMPKVRLPLKPGPKPDWRSSTFNLLFFGDFIRMDYPAYKEAMEEVMNDDSLAYEMQVREIYTLGKFLGAKKYRFVRLAYLSFISGALASALVVLLSALI